MQMYPEEGEQKKHEPRIPSGSSQAHGGKSFWGPCGALPAPALLGTYRPSRSRSADAPAGPGPESHLCSAPAAPAPRTPASRARLTASSFRAAVARGAPWPGPRCSSRSPAPRAGPAHQVPPRPGLLWTSRRQPATPVSRLVLTAETPSTSKQTSGVPNSKSSSPW